MVDIQKDIQKQSNKTIILASISEIVVGIILGFVGNYVFGNTTRNFNFKAFYFTTTAVSLFLAIILASFIYRKEKNITIAGALTLCLTILGALASFAFTVAIGIMRWN